MILYLHMHNVVSVDLCCLRDRDREHLQLGMRLWFLCPVRPIVRPFTARACVKGGRAAHGCVVGVCLEVYNSGLYGFTRKTAGEGSWQAPIVDRATA